MLNVVRQAIVDESLHLLFDYFAISRRCKGLLTSLKKQFIGAEAKPEIYSPSYQKAKLTVEYQIESSPETREHFFEKVMLLFSSGYCKSIVIMSLLSDPESVPDAEKLFEDAAEWYHTFRSTNISMAKVGKIMSLLIENEGDREIKKAEAFGKSEISDLSDS